MDLILMSLGLILACFCAVGMVHAVYKNDSGQFMGCSLGVFAGVIIAYMSNLSLLGG